MKKKINKDNIIIYSGVIALFILGFFLLYTVIDIHNTTQSIINFEKCGKVCTVFDNTKYKFRENLGVDATDQYICFEKCLCQNNMKPLSDCDDLAKEIICSTTFHGDLQELME